MKRLFFCIGIFMFICVIAHSQSLKKYPIGNTGCSVYAFCSLENFDSSKSQDSSDVFTAGCEKEDLHYGVILIKLTEKIQSLSDAEATAIAYLDFLKTTFSISSAVGYGKGHILRNNNDTRGVIDYWKDEENNNWKIKAWTDGQFIAVLYAYTANELPDTKLNVFLDGFRFKGM